jgi:two-component system OmpR family sensor kinase
MKIFKSIKWRLQIWYGLILVVVLAGFGFTAYQLERNRQFRRIDEQLQHPVGGLLNALRTSFWGELGPNGEPIPGRPPPPPDQQPPDRPFRDHEPDRSRLPAEFHLPPWNALFVENDTNSFYCVVWSRDGRELFRSTNAPVDLRVSMRADSPGPQPPRMRGVFREFFQTTPRGERILVGRSIAPELAELRLTALKLAGVGGIILFFGLAGGWWLVSCSLCPISEISATAIKISAGDLSQRINVAEAESELGQLAAVLNSTFARLETAFAQQKQFASDAAHELRTPVSVMLTQTQTALNRERDAASYKQTVEACQRAAQRMRKLIESLLALARFDAGQEVLNRLRFDFSKTVADCAELVQPLADERSVKIFTDLSPLEITGDSERLAQVVTNLLTNAIQYNRIEGEVRVKVEAQNGLAALTVTDTGQGIPAEDLPRVFRRFFRADQSRTGAGNAGLGLAISKAIVEAHGGTIEVASEENTGTTFTVHLPASV